jgi:hypothetical protein
MSHYGASVFNTGGQATLWALPLSFHPACHPSPPSLTASPIFHFLPCRHKLLDFISQHCRTLCSSAPPDLLRTVYESVRDNTGIPSRDGEAEAEALRLHALTTLTNVLTGLNMLARDSRLVKVHVETLYRIVERSCGNEGASEERVRMAAGEQ